MPDRTLAVITGATGFIGGNLARHLLGQGYRLRLLVRDPSRLEELAGPDCQVVRGDIQHAADLQGLAEGADLFFHIAALFRAAGFPDQVYRQINVEGTRHCLEEARRAGVRRFVHCSTVGVLGNIEKPPADESTPYNPGDIYQETKVEGERLALEYFRTGRLPGVVVRPAMVYGAGDRRMLKLFKPVAHRRFMMLGSGNVRHHYVYIDDLVEGFRLAGTVPGIEGEVFIIAGPDSVRLQDMVGMIARSAGVAAPRLHLPVQPFQWLGSLCEAIFIPLHLEPPIYRRRVDFFTKNRSFAIGKAQRLLGYQPQIDTREGVRRTLEWYRSHNLL